MKLIVKLLCLIALAVAVFSLQPQPVQATILDPVCQTPAAANSPVCKDANKTGNNNPVSGPKGVIQTATNLIAIAAGIIAVIVIIASGIMYATAGGLAQGQRAGDNPTRAKNARAMLLNAVVGLALIVLTWSLASFIIQKVISS